MNVVEKIYAQNPNRPRVNYSRRRAPISLIQSLDDLKSKGYTGIICEFKRKSPSGFSNIKNLQPVEYFRTLKHKAVAGFSVLTEPDFFNGSYSDVCALQDLNRPILDKDFISSTLMVDNAYRSGADAILLILDFLDEKTVYDLADYAVSLGLEALVEFHEIGLVESLFPGKGIIFGYNRRNLKTLSIEPEEGKVMELLSGKGIRFILESGIDSSYLKSHDVNSYAGMLIGASVLNGELSLQE